MIYYYSGKVDNEYNLGKVDLTRFKYYIEETLEKYLGNHLRYVKVNASQFCFEVDYTLENSDARKLNWLLALYIPKAYKLAVSYDNRTYERHVSPKLFRFRRSRK